MDLLVWLRTWVGRHPLKEPLDHDPMRYTAVVMEKVKALHQSAPTPAAVLKWKWFSWPRVGLAVAAVAVGLLLVITLPGRAPVQLADQILQRSSVLAELDDPGFVPMANGDGDSLAEEMETLDTMMLAQSPPSDDQWLDQTLALLDQLDDEEAVSGEDSGSASEEEWLKELQLLDESELSASS